MAARGAGVQRRERPLRASWRHEQLSVLVEVATALHHSYDVSEPMEVVRRFDVQCATTQAGDERM